MSPLRRSPVPIASVAELSRWWAEVLSEPRPSCLTPVGRLTTIVVMTTQSLAAVKAHFSQVIDEVSGTHERVTITKNGSPVAVLLAVEDYESLMETLDILSDPDARSAIRQPETEMAGGEVYDEAQVRPALAARRRLPDCRPTPSSCRSPPSGPSSSTSPSRSQSRS